MHLASASGPSYKHVIHVHLARDGASGSALRNDEPQSRLGQVLRVQHPPWACQPDVGPRNTTNSFSGCTARPSTIAWDASTPVRYQSKRGPRPTAQKRLQRYRNSESCESKVLLSSSQVIPYASANLKQTTQVTTGVCCMLHIDSTD